MRILIISNRAEKDYSNLKEAVGRVAGCWPEVVYFNDEELLEKVSKYSPDAIVLSGSPTLFTEIGFDDFEQEIKLIKEGNFPILGICAGHQLIAHTFGANVRLNPTGERINGFYPIHLIVSDDSVFKGLSSPVEMWEIHFEEVESLPTGFIHLASSDLTKIEGFRHSEKPIYGFQFHPELSGKVGDIILKNFFEIATSRINSVNEW